MPSSVPPRLRSNLLLVAAVTAFVGFADSAYLTADHYFALPLPCSILHGCEVVLHSVYATIGPIPLALLGVAYYLLMLGFALYLYTSDTISKKTLTLFALLAGIGLALSIVFEGIQFFLIHALCMYCALSALCTLVLAIVSVRLVRLIQTHLSTK